MKKKNKKAQMEMMGLTVIVVLVAIGMLFFISFNINSTSTTEEPKQEYNEKQLATNYILALLKTTTSCKDLTIQDLLQDAALPAYSTLSCSGSNSTEYVNQTIDEIIDNSLETWHTQYLLKIKHGDRMIFQRNSTKCTEQTRAEATGYQPISLYPDSNKPIIVTLRVCKQ